MKAKHDGWTPREQEQEQEQDESVRPFSCGSQYQDWRYRNCDNCKKSYDNMPPKEQNEAKGKGPCDIDNAISSACVGPGTVDKAIADRMGYTPEMWLSWDCPELEPK